MLSKGNDGMPHLISSDWVCCPRAMMACNARCRSTMCDAYGRYSNATADIIQPCVIPKGDYGMSSLTSSGHLRCPMPMRSYHARHHQTMCAIQRRLSHAKFNMVRPCLYFKGDDGLPCLPPSDCVCCPRAMMACHARRFLTLCASQGR